MNAAEAREAFDHAAEEIRGRAAVLEFLREALTEPIAKVRREVMASGGVDPGELYIAAILMGMLMERHLKDNEMTAETVLAAVESELGGYFRRVREGDGGVAS